MNPEIKDLKNRNQLLKFNVILELLSKVGGDKIGRIKQGKQLK